MKNAKNSRLASYVGRCFKLEDNSAFMITFFKNDMQMADAEPYFGIKLISYNNDVNEEQASNINWLMWVDDITTIINGALGFEEFLSMKKTEIPYYEFNKILGKIKKNVEKSNY